MKCSGIKCVTPVLNPSAIPEFSLGVPSPLPMGLPPVPLPVPHPTGTELDALMQPPLTIPRPPFDNFIFKQNNRFRNLRG